MSPTQLLEKATNQKIGKTPVVVLLLKDWKKIEEILENHEMIASRNYKKNIALARKEIKDGKLHKFDLKNGKFIKT